MTGSRGRRTIATQLRFLMLAISCALVVGPAVAAPVAAAGGPQVEPPVSSFKRLGTLSMLSVPLVVSWPAGVTDGSPIYRYQLERSVDGGAFAPVPLAGRLSRSATVFARPWTVVQFRARAIDEAAVTGPWATANPFVVQVHQEYKPEVSLTTGWQLIADKYAFGRLRAKAGQGGEAASLDFDGRQVAWVARLGPDRGSATVALDGIDYATVSLKRSSASSRRIVFRAAWPAAGAHSIDVTSTSGSTIDLDALLVMADATPATLVGAGDIAVCGDLYTNDEATGALAKAVVDEVGATVFTAGDNAYPNGDAANYANCYEPAWGSVKDATRPSPGNHDYANNPGAPNYYAYFGSAAGKPGQGWYSYDLGTWRIYALNSECTTGNQCDSAAQYDWLKADLAAEPHRCVAAMWHRPRFSSGAGHGSSTRMASIFQLLYDNGAEIVLSGHDHDYERFAPLDPTGALSSVGVRQWVVGTGGAGLYSLATPLTGSEVRDNTSHGVLRLNLTAGGYSWEFLPVPGDLFTDSGSATCH